MGSAHPTGTTGLGERISSSIQQGLAGAGITSKTFGFEPQSVNPNDLSLRARASQLVQQVGDVHTSLELLGRETPVVFSGAMYRGGNIGGKNIRQFTLFGTNEEDSILHPFFAARLKKYESDFFANGDVRRLIEQGKGINKTDLVGLGEPGRHAEVIAASKVLSRIEKRIGRNLDNSEIENIMEDMLLYNIGSERTRQYQQSWIRCSNCQVLTNGIKSISDLPTSVRKQILGG